MKSTEDPIALEVKIAALFNSGVIHAPLDLYFGNAHQQIEVFWNVRPQD